MKPLELDPNASFAQITKRTRGLAEDVVTFTRPTINIDGPYQPAMTPTETVVTPGGSKPSPNMDDERWNQTVAPQKEFPGDYPKP